MNTVFIGGSRYISRLPSEVKRRLDNVIASGHEVIVGDANGADKAVQKHFKDSRYDRVIVFCSGDRPRNNLGSWQTHHVEPPKNAKGFHFFAAKDREMARKADFGLMIWDGKSAGTVLNVLQLVRAGKISVLFNVPEKTALNIKSIEQWNTFLSQRSADLRSDLKERATPEEWGDDRMEAQPSLLSSLDDPSSHAHVQSQAVPFSEAVTVINRALASGDAASVMDTLGGIARDRGMSRVARDAGLARESLYRSLDATGNPEFATILKVFSSIGLRLEARVDGDTERRGKG
jgi:probable addiction module antidote protein